MIRSFSVIVPVLNKENEIIRTLQSIEDSITFFFQQPYTEAIAVEVLVVNEGSTDQTLARVTEFSQTKPHYKIINHFKSLGIGPARNTGAKMSCGDLLFFCDGDDLIFKEHFYLCYKLLNHQPGESSETFFKLQSDRGSYTINLPQHPVGMVRTGVYMQDTLHPHWKAAIENTIALNLAIRRDCHEFVEGFPEAPVYKQIGCEDISYDLWAGKFFKLLKIDLETVEYIRYPGNNFDRQLQKFQTPPEQYQDHLPPADRELHTVRQRLEQDRLTYLLDKLSRNQTTPELAAILTWQQLAESYLALENYREVISLCEQGMAREPALAATVKSLLAVAYNNQGSALHQQKNWPQAVDCFEKAIALQPPLSATDLARIHYNAAAALKDQQDYKAALPFLEQALVLNAQLPEAIAALAEMRYIVEVQAKGYEFSQNWFGPHIPTWEKVVGKLAGAPGLKVLEIGSWEGRSTCWMIDHLLTDAAARITCIDTFLGSVEHPGLYDAALTESVEARFDRNIARTDHPEKVRKLVAKSQSALRSLVPNSFHLVYIDGSHIASDVLEDAMLSWRLVKIGGLIVFDDYGYKFPDGIIDQPAKIAIDAIVKIFDRKVKVLHQGYQMFLEKVGE
jgi:tetratricopeptide (TPR) repeat protein